jgi:hypothetical protein
VFWGGFFPNRYTNIILKLGKEFYPEYSFYICISIKKKSEFKKHGEGRK